MFKGHTPLTQLERNTVTSACVWMNIVRGIAVIGVVIHHWLLFIPHQGPTSLSDIAADVVQTLGGTAVHLFFILICLGIGLYGVSWAIQKYWTLGGAYNDLLTAVGVYLMTLYACHWILRFSWKGLVDLLNQVSKHSYLMYLIHGPLILFVVRPVLENLTEPPMNSLVMIVLAGIYCIVIFALSRLIHPLIDSLGSRLVPIRYSP